MKMKVSRMGGAVGSFLYNCFYMAAMGFTSSMLPIYATELGADVSAIGPIWTLAFLSSFLMAFFWGTVSDRSGRRTPHIIAGTAILSLICILYTFVENIYYMGIVMIIGGILGSSQAFPIFMTFVSELSERDKMGRSMGVFWTGGSVGWALSVSVAGFISEQYGIRAGFYLSSALYILSLVAVRGFFSADTRKTPVERRVSYGEGIKGIKRLGAAFTVFWLATVCFYIADMVKVSFVLIFFEQELGLKRALATLVLSLGTWVEIPSLLVLGGLSDRIGRKPLLLLGLFALFIFNISLSLCQDWLQATLTMLLFGIVWGAFTPASSALVGDMVEEQSRAKAMSLYNSAGSIASVIAPTLMSFAILKTDFRSAFVVVAAVVMLGLLLVLFGVRASKDGGGHGSAARSGVGGEAQRS